MARDGQDMTDKGGGAPVGWVLGSLSMAMLLPSLGTSIANIGLPALAEAFGAPFAEVQWIVLAYLLATTTLIVSVGRLGDIVGRRRLMLAGIALFTAASALCGLAPTLPLLIAARAAQGLGAAVMMALAVAFVGGSVPKERTGSAMGLLGTMSAVGTALGPSLGGLLISLMGWRWIFLINLPLGVAGFILVRRFLPADGGSEGPRGRFDWAGTLLLGGALAAYALAMTVGRGRFGAINATLLIAALAGAGVFVLVQARSAAPLIRPAAFRDAGFSAGLAMNALVSTVMMATLVVAPFYLSRGLGLGEALAGAVMASGPVVSILSGVPAGRLVDRAGAAFITHVGLALMAAGTVTLAAMPASFGIAGYIGAILLLTPGYQLFQAANNTAVMADVTAERRGVMSGMLSLSRNLGLITGASVMGTVFAVGVGRADIATALPVAVADGMHLAFAVAAGLVVVAIAIAATVRSRAGRVLAGEAR